MHHQTDDTELRQAEAEWRDLLEELSRFDPVGWLETNFVRRDDWDDDINSQIKQHQVKSNLSGDMTYQIAASASGAVVFHHRVQERVTEVNAAFFENILELPHLQKLSLLEYFEKYVHPCDRANVLGRARKYAEKQKMPGPNEIVNIVDQCYRLVLPHVNKLKFISTNGKVYFDGMARPIASIGMYIDQTASMELEGERVRAQQLAQFIDYTSHNLRNPLSGCFGSVESMESTLQDMQALLRQLADDGIATKLQQGIDELFEFKKSIEECAKHQKDLLDDVLTLSRLEAGRVELRKEQTQLDELVLSIERIFARGGKCKRDQDDSVSTASDKKQQTLRPVWLDENGARIETDELAKLRMQGALFVETDCFYLKEILLNLVSNSMKYSEEDVELCVQLLQRQEASSETTPCQLRVRFSVVDHGIGISKEAIDTGQLFSRFKQLHGKNYSGSGLGLFLVKQLLEKFDRSTSIQVESELGKGSNFSFELTFPVVCGGEKGSESDESDDEAAKPAPGDIARPPIRATHHTIIIVEDNTINQKLLSRFVRDKCGEGAKILLFSDGQDVVEFFESTTSAEELSKISMVITDVMMPKMTGIDATIRIRQIERHKLGDVLRQPLLPIVGLSGNARTEHRKEAIDAGMTDYCVKPFTKQQIHALMDRYLPELDDSK